MNNIDWIEKEINRLEMVLSWVIGITAKQELTNEIQHFQQIKQDLNKLEQLEKIFSDSHICEIKARFNEIKCDADKCDNCPLGIGDDICLKHTFENKWKFQTERDKLKQAIEILKDRLVDYQGMELQKRWYDAEEEWHYFLVFDENFEIELVDEYQYKIIKEVLKYE